jgi:hypothetical protein
VNARKLVTIAAAAALAITPMAANAAASLSVARAMAPTSGVSYLQDDVDGDNIGGGSTAVIIGVLLIVLLGAVAISGGDEVSNSP